MTKIIGNVLPDGRVKYIRCNDSESIRVIARLLTMFYSRQSRSDALLALGNIECLGPSPYGESKGSSDYIHCVAAIRDCREDEHENKAEVITGKEIFLEANCPAFLFENGHWLLVWKKEFIPIKSFYDIPVVRNVYNRNLSYISISTDKDRAKRNGDIQKFDFPTWGEMCQNAISYNDTYYIFRSKRLIASINQKQAI